MSTSSHATMKPRKRPEAPGIPVQVRLQPRDLDALDAFLKSADDPLTRPQAIRAILADWLTGHGFLKHREDPEGAT